MRSKVTATIMTLLLALSQLSSVLAVPQGDNTELIKTNLIVEGEFTVDAANAQPNYVLTTDDTSGLATWQPVSVSEIGDAEVTGSLTFTNATPDALLLKFGNTGISFDSGTSKLKVNTGLDVTGILDAMSITASNIGIGVAAPSDVVLDVGGDVRIRAGGSSPDDVLVSDGSGKASWKPLSALGSGSSDLNNPSVTGTLSFIDNVLDPELEIDFGNIGITVAQESGQDWLKIVNESAPMLKANLELDGELRVGSLSIPGGIQADTVADNVVINGPTINNSNIVGTIANPTEVDGPIDMSNATITFPDTIDLNNVNFNSDNISFTGSSVLAAKINRLVREGDDYISPTVYVHDDGNVGIGKGLNEPGSKLDVAGTVTATGFSGPGAGITGLDSSNFVGGSINANQLGGQDPDHYLDNTDVQSISFDELSSILSLTRAGQSDSTVDLSALQTPDTTLSGDDVDGFVADELTENYTPRRNDTELVDGSIFDDGTNVGIGTDTIDAGVKLQVDGTIKATGFSGPGTGITGLTASNFTGDTITANTIEDGVTINHPTIVGTVANPTQVEGPIDMSQATITFPDTIDLNNVNFNSNNISFTGSSVLAAKINRLVAAGDDYISPTVYVHDSGNVGIGTSLTLPNAKLEVDGSFLADRITSNGYDLVATGTTDPTYPMFSISESTAEIPDGFAFDFYSLAKIEPPTIEAELGTSPSLSTAASLEITGAPIAGNDVTIEDSYALLVSGKTKIEGDLEITGGSLEASNLITDFNPSNIVFVGADGNLTEETGAEATDHFVWKTGANQLGIGTSNPQFGLHVVKQGGKVARFEHGGDDPGSALEIRAATAFVRLLSYDASGSPEKMILSASPAPAAYPDNPFGTQDQLVLAKTGNVGIGDFKPDAKLEVAGDVKATNFIGSFEIEQAKHLVIRDVNNDIYYLGDDVSTAPSGVVLRAETNPASKKPLFVVESSGHLERLRVEHDGALYTENYLMVNSTAPSSIKGNLTIGTVATPKQLDVTGETLTNSLYLKKSAVSISVSASAGAPSIDWTSSNRYVLNLDADATNIEFIEPDSNKVGSLILEIKQIGGGHTIADFDSLTRWPGGFCPPISSADGAVDILSCLWDGSNYYCQFSKDFKPKGNI